MPIGTIGIKRALSDIHRMPALSRLSFPLSMDFGNANSSARDSRAPKPVTSARRAPKMWVSLSSRRTSPLVFDRTQNNQALHVDAGGYDTDPLVLYEEDKAFHIRLARAGLSLVADEEVLIVSHRGKNSMSSDPVMVARAVYHTMRKTAEAPNASRYRSEISAQLWETAYLTAAYLEWESADQAAALATDLAGASTSGLREAFRFLCQLSPRMALRVRESYIRLFKPHLRAGYPGWRSR